MRNTIVFLIVGGIASVITIPLVAAFFSQSKRNSSSELRERDEIRQSFKLTPGTRVEVSSISGSVEIETADSDVAEIHIVRSAQSRGDLEQFKIGIENKPQSLVIRGETRQGHSGSGFGPEVRHSVMLKLPRRVELSVRSVSAQVRIGDVDGSVVVSSVSGPVSIGAVEGRIQVSSVSGGVEIAQVSQQAEIRGVSGDVNIKRAKGFLDVSGVSGLLTAGISTLGQRGLQIKGISGEVELRFSGELNAQLSTDSISGKVSIEVPNVTRQKSSGGTAIRAMIGKGGPPISISGVSRNVLLAQGS